MGPTSFRRPSASWHQSTHPAFRELVANLADELPHFRAHSSDITVVTEPQQFYQEVLSAVARAKRRLFFASLYVGKEEKELVEAFHTALKKNPSLRLDLLVDYLRSTREHPRSPCSASLLSSLQASFPSQVNVRLFHTAELHGWRKRLIPRRFDEGWGLQHMKIYGSDDDVILSGANLSHDYFTHRQDRYIRFSNHPPLADYFQSLVDTVSARSFALKGRSSTPRPSYDLQWPAESSSTHPFRSSSSAAAFADEAAHALKSHTETWRIHSQSPLLPPRAGQRRPDTDLFAMLQMGSFGIKHESESVVPQVLKCANALASSPGGSATTLDWTSGYFSMLREYKTRVLDTRARVRIVAAAPEANGFHNSAGVSKYIPPAYTYLERLFYDDVVRLHKEGQVELREWKRNGWTYHAKGIWLSPAHSISASAHIPHLAWQAPTHNPGALAHATVGSPTATLIGSSNFGRRSAERDLEAGLLVVTDGEQLRTKLKAEVDGLRSWADDVVDRSLFARPERKVGWGVRLAARSIRNML